MTLRLKLILMSAGMVTVLALVNYVQFGRVLEQQQMVAVEQIEGHAVALGNAIATQFFERYQDVQAFAANDSLRKDKPNVAELTTLFDEYSRIYGVYDVVLFVDTEGNFVASNSRSPEGRPLLVNRIRSRNYANTNWFRNAISGQFTEDGKKNLTGAFVEDVQIDPIASAANGSNRLGNSFSTVVKNAKGQVMGVLTCRANFDWVESEVRSYYSYLRSRGLVSASVAMVNKAGLTLSDYDPSANRGNAETMHDFDRVILKQNLASDQFAPASEIVAGRSGATIAMHPMKKERLASGYQSFRGHPKMIDTIGWGIIVSIAESDAYATITVARNQLIAVSSVVMCLFTIMAYWFAVMVSSRLTKLSENISETSGQVMAGSEQMSSASQSLASTATEAASSLEETVSSIEQLASMVKRNADHAMEAANLSRASRESADSGEVEIHKLVDAMNEINHSSKKIEDIINVIDDIAFQTNLLALNAAVEAARAGDQGKGFAVVAEEVRNLAQRSAAAAKDITSLIKENVSKIESGVEIAGLGGTALRAIVSSVRKVADLNSEIASASKEQSHGLEQISQAMTQLDQVTQTNAASAEEVASSAEEMSSQGLMLQETVSRLNALIHGTKAAKVRAAQTAAKTGFSAGFPNQKVIPMRTKSPADKVIPFDSDGDGGNLGSTSGF